MVGFPFLWTKVRSINGVARLVERDATYGVELVPPPASPSWESVVNQMRARDRGFDPMGFYMPAIEILYRLRLHEAANLFGAPPVPLDPLPAGRVTADLQRRRSELVEKARQGGGEWIRQLSGLQSAPVAVSGDQNWEAIIFWENYIAEMKVIGRDGQFDGRTYENPDWNATFADYVTFIRPLGTSTPANPEAPFTWLLHDITPDPGATRRLDRASNVA